MLDRAILLRLEKAAQEMSDDHGSTSRERAIAKDIKALIDENARLAADNAHLRAEKALIWDKTNTPLCTCHDIET